MGTYPTPHTRQIMELLMYLCTWVLCLHVHLQDQSRGQDYRQQGAAMRMLSHLSSPETHNLTRKMGTSCMTNTQIKAQEDAIQMLTS